MTGFIKAASIVFTWRNLQESRREHQKKNRENDCWSTLSLIISIDPLELKSYDKVFRQIMIERVFCKRVVSTLDASNLIKSMSNLLSTQGTQPA